MLSLIGFTSEYLILFLCGVAVNYKKPPVVETVISVQFKPMADFGAAQLGAYWKQLGDDWPAVVDAPAVEQVFERFETAPIWDPAAAGFKLSQKIDLRLQIRNQSRDRMIQIQNGRFFYNWLGTPGGAYPSYELVRPEFDEHWEKFRGFVVSESEESVVEANLWEIIYVNHMMQGTVWSELSELPLALRFLNQPTLNSNLSVDGIGGEWRYEISPKKGRLYIRLGMKKKDDTPCVVMTLSARGPIDDNMTLHNGLELGHTKITDAFDQLTSSDAQRYWKVQHAGS